MQQVFPITDYLHKLWGGPPWSAAGPLAGLSPQLQILVRYEPRADLGVRPTIYAESTFHEKHVAFRTHACRVETL